MTDAATTEDAVFGGAVTVAQHRRGYRFTADALWVVAAARGLARGHVVDLGAGCGVIGLSLALCPGVERVTLVELSPTLAALARRSVELSRPPCAASVLPGDVRDLQTTALAAPADLVVCNPPYYTATATRRPASSEADHAKRALDGRLEDFVAAGGRLLVDDGALVIAYPARWVGRLLAALQERRLGVRSLHLVRARPTAQARLVIVVARRNIEAEAEIPPAWTERDSADRESPEAAALRDVAFLRG